MSFLCLAPDICRGRKNSSNSGASRNLIARKGDPFADSWCGIRGRNSGIRRNVLCFFRASGGKFRHEGENIRIRHSRESGNLIALQRDTLPEFCGNVRLAAQRFPLSREWCYFCFFWRKIRQMAENSAVRRKFCIRRQFRAIIRARPKNAVCFIKRGITMKNSTLAIRAVYAAFMRVLSAIPASFLNLEGGGGAENERPRNDDFARLRMRFCRLSCPAVCGGRGESASGGLRSSLMFSRRPAVLGKAARKATRLRGTWEI